MPVTVNVIISGVKIDDEIRSFITTTNQRAKNDTFNLGKKTLKFITNYIESNRKRPKGINSLLLMTINQTYEEFDLGDTWGFSLGDISTLNMRAPYWRAINYGSNHIVGRKVPTGQFIPGQPKPMPSQFRRGRWETIGGGGYQFGFETYSFVPKKGIPPMNYIQNTFNYVVAEIDKMLATTGKTSVLGTKTFVPAWGKNIRFGTGG